MLGITFGFSLIYLAVLLLYDLYNKKVIPENLLLAGFLIAALIPPYTSELKGIFLIASVFSFVYLIEHRVVSVFNLGLADYAAVSTLLIANFNLYYFILLSIGIGLAALLLDRTVRGKHNVPFLSAIFVGAVFAAVLW